MGEPNRQLHPNLHPIQYQYRVKEDIRLMIPTEGIIPMGSSRGVPGYGLIHPNTINAAVLQRYGVVQPECSFDAMSLAPNFDLLLNKRQAERVTQQIVGWELNNENPFTSRFNEKEIVRVPPVADPEKL